MECKLINLSGFQCIQMDSFNKMVSVVNGKGCHVINLALGERLSRCLDLRQSASYAGGRIPTTKTT
jgi:hypothetical protein